MNDDQNSQPSIGALVVTHGGLGTELLAATERIVGATAGLTAISLDWDDPVAGARQQIEDGIAGLGCTGGTLIFTDMFGGTPTNVCLPFLEAGQVEIITGVNLPMLVKFTTLQFGDQQLAHVANDVRDRGQSSIHLASEILTNDESL